MRIDTQTIERQKELMELCGSCGLEGVISTVSESVFLVEYLYSIVQ